VRQQGRAAGLHLEFAILECALVLDLTEGKRGR
jgi:hypothetical protein